MISSTTEKGLSVPPSAKAIIITSTCHKMERKKVHLIISVVYILKYFLFWAIITTSLRLFQRTMRVLRLLHIMGQWLQPPDRTWWWATAAQSIRPLNTIVLPRGLWQGCQLFRSKQLKSKVNMLYKLRFLKNWKSRTRSTSCQVDITTSTAE